MATSGGRALPLVVALLACGKDPHDRLLGWPPREDVVPYGLPEVVDTYEPPEVEEVVAEVVDVEVVPPPLPPCAALVEHACNLWTPFADACREARTKIPDDGHAITREACAALLARFQGEQRHGNPCGRYSRAICAESGEASERCVASRRRTGLLTERREWNACLADLIWFEARLFRR